MEATTWPPARPEASCLSDYEWTFQAQMARHYVKAGAPFLLDERHDHVKLTWRLEEGREVRLERIAMLDPDAGGAARLESWLRDRVVETVFGVPHVAIPVVLAATALVTAHAAAWRAGDHAAADAAARRIWGVLPRGD